MMTWMLQGIAGSVSKFLLDWNLAGNQGGILADFMPNLKPVNYKAVLKVV